MSTIRVGHLGDREVIVSLLDLCGLPVADLVVEPAANMEFLVMEDTAGNHLMGCVGLQNYGSIGLLRSFAVSPRYRHQRVGGQLLEALHRQAEVSGIRQIYLLTTTASAYFERAGYRPVSRDAAPAAIQRSTEFSTLCPATAVVMTLSL